MRRAIDGLKARLGEEKLEVVCVPESGPQGDEALRLLRGRQPRLLVALGTPALIKVAPVEKNTPVVFALVANPYFTGAAYFPDKPELHQENITGIFSPPPLDQGLEHGASLLGSRVWGLLYDPNDGVAAELKERFLQEAPENGLKPVVAASSEAATDRRGLKRLMAAGARVIYLPPAPSAARYAPLLLEWGKKRRVMVVSGHPEWHQGAILWVTLNYHKLGEAAGALALRVLKGAAPANIPLEEKTPLKIQVDDKLVRYWSGYPAPKI